MFNCTNLLFRFATVNNKHNVVYRDTMKEKMSFNMMKTLVYRSALSYRTLSFPSLPFPSFPFPLLPSPPQLTEESPCFS